MIQRVDVLGVQISAINMDGAVRCFESWIEDDARQYVCITGVHGVIEAQGDSELLRIHNQSGLTTPDGMPLVWCGRYAGADWISRVYGPDLMLRICETGVEHTWSHFFYGAGPGVAADLALNLSEKFPGLKISGIYSPPFRPLTDSDVRDHAKLINNAGPDIVWVGLSTPKQEHWMARFRPLLDARVLVGVGAAFDIHAGRVRQAPVWLQRSGLEWVFRLAMEPRRLWRRYLRANPRFVFAVVRRPPQLVKEPT